MDKNSGPKLSFGDMFIPIWRFKEKYIKDESCAQPKVIQNKGLTGFQTLKTQTRSQSSGHTWPLPRGSCQSISAWFLWPEKQHRPFLNMHSCALTFCRTDFILPSSLLTISSSVSRVTLKMSPCSVWARKKNMDLVLWVAEQTNIMPRSGSSRSFCRMGQRKKREQNKNKCAYRDKKWPKTDTHKKTSGVGVMTWIVTDSKWWWWGGCPSIWNHRAGLHYYSLNYILNPYSQEKGHILMPYSVTGSCSKNTPKPAHQA